MSTDNCYIGFCEEMTKVIFQLSSNRHCICSSGNIIKWPNIQVFYATKTSVDASILHVSCNNSLIFFSSVC